LKFNLDESHHYLQAPLGQYKVCLTVVNLTDCISQSCKEISIAEAIGKAETIGGIKVYPNPNSGNFAIEIPVSVAKANYEILDLMGKTVEHGKLREGTNVINLSVAKGLYLIKVINAENIFTHKIYISQ